MQSTMLDEPPIAVDGLLLSEAGESITYAVAETATIPAGRFVRRGTDPVKQCKLPALTTDITTVANVYGIAIHQATKEESSDALVGEGVHVLRKGKIYVQVEDAVVAGGAVYVRFTAGAGALTVGRFRSDADTNKASVLANALYLTSADAAGFALVGINFP